MLRDLLALEGIKTGRLHVATLMKRMAIEAIYRKPNTSKPMQGTDLSVSPAQSACDEPDQSGQRILRTFLCARLCLSRCSDRLFSRRVLSHRVSITMEAEFCIEALQEALAKHGSRKSSTRIGQPIHQRRFHQRAS